MLPMIHSGEGQRTAEMRPGSSGSFQCHYRATAVPLASDDSALWGPRDCYHAELGRLLTSTMDPSKDTNQSQKNF